MLSVSISSFSHNVSSSEFFNSLPHNTAFWYTRDMYIAVENIVREGEIPCKKQFLLFSQRFLSYMVLIFHLNAL